MSEPARTTAALRAVSIFIVWCIVYCAVTCALLAFRWLGLDLPLPVQTFLLTVVLVPALALVITPAVSRYVTTRHRSRHSTATSKRIH